MTGNGVVIVGGGLAAQRCAQTLRKQGFEDPVRIVCAESVAPYDRPPLSKGNLAGSSGAKDVSLKPTAWYDENSIELILGRRALSLDSDSHRIHLDDGTQLTYDKLLIATGSQARELPALAGFENVHSLRTVSDSMRLGAELGRGGHLAVIGSGFIGQEVAATARTLGDQVTIVEAMESPLAHILGPNVGTRLGRIHLERGVDLMTDAMVESAIGNGRVEELLLADGRRVTCDTVVVGIGVRPSTDWLEGSGLELDGILTDTGARTSVPDVFAAGDVTRSLDPRTGIPARSEHWDSAVRQGRAAALSMLGMPAPKPALPSFWSDQYENRIQFVGHAELADRVEVEESEDGDAFAARYLRQDRLVGVLAIGQPRTIASAGRTIEEHHETEPEKRGTKNGM
ncbi:MAG: FAD-dependent oxidoreductase [Thermoleophilia bacterium]|nr:FAD-dependent oxidoreductase [Thermoleophilia bacterium]